MALLKRLRDGREYVLEARHTVGRALESRLHLCDSHVSTHHAAVSWLDRRWRLKDLGSLNGTFLNGVRAEPGRWHDLKEGDLLSFGDIAIGWVLTDVAAPEPMLVPEHDGQPIVITDRLAAMPSGRAEATVALDERGSWWLETADGARRPLSEGEWIEIDNERWRLSNVGQSVVTEELVPQYRIEDTRLCLRHSRDEEHVEVVVETAGQRVSLGSSTNNELLLLLARRRVEDERNGVPEGSCGWIYQEDCTEALKEDRQQLNLRIFRIRKQFLAAGFRSASDVIERRPSTRQLRIGFRRPVVAAL